jgi:predicted RNase H-like nuclease (RuvC/YqgF family)
MRDNREISEMMREAKRLRDEWESWLLEMKEYNRTTTTNNYPRKDIAEAVRNFNALRGVVKSLQWAMEMPGVDDPLW